MNAEALLAQYERIAEAPDAIALLRRFVLDLAVRGKLVAQDERDEPAAELLDRVARERARRAAGRSARDFPVLAKDEVPFSLPDGWSWARLGSLGVTQTGTTPPKSRPDFYGQYIPFVRPGDLYETHVDYSGEGLSDLGAAESGRIASTGSLLMVCIGTIGKCQLIDRECSFNQQINSLSPFHGIEPRYLLGACRSDVFQSAAWAASARTTIAILNKGNWEHLPIPVPPLAEQHRIVAKVDELMALCDRLEAARTAREATRDRLAAASLARLNTPDPETFPSDARFALAALAALTTRPDQIKHLRQTILNLAVRGKLVPQDPSDEPASALLKGMVHERQAAVSRRKIRGAEPPASPSVEDEDFHLPRPWQLCALGQITLVTDPNPSHRYPDYTGGTVPILSTREFDGDDGWDTATAKLVPLDVWDLQRETCDFAAGDIVFARKGRLGMPRFLPKLDAFTFSHTLFVIKPMSGLDPAYLLWVLRRDEVVGWLTNEMNQNTGVPTLGKAKTERLPIPLPPAAEQYRIVAKINELMALCDALEASLAAATDTRTRLLDATLREALASDAHHFAEAAE
jgi:type I restriction enzyme S subunit